MVNYCGWLWNPSPADRWFIPLYIQYWINVIYRLQLFAVYIVDKYFCLIWILPPQFLIDMNIPNDLATIHSINIHRWSPRQPREAQDWQQRRTARQEEQLALQARGWHPTKDRRIWLVWYDQWLPSGKLTVGPWQIEVGRWVSIETVLFSGSMLIYQRVIVVNSG